MMKNNFLLAFSVLLLEGCKTSELNDSRQKEEIKQMTSISITGWVMKPGFYKVEDGQTIEKIVSLAGGLSGEDSDKYSYRISFENGQKIVSKSGMKIFPSKNGVVSIGVLSAKW